MKALRVSKEGSSEPTVTIEVVPTPSPGPSELLVKIAASPVQPSDILNSKGRFPNTTFPRTLGRDFAGTVVEGSDAWKGKRVFGTSGDTFSFTVDGAHAEYAILPENAVAEIPSKLSFAQAASLGTPWTTADMTLSRGGAKAGETVMVLGATGGVGSAVMQIAKLLGCKTISVGRHGTDIDSTSDRELGHARELTNGEGPDIVVDTVGDFALTKAAFNVLGYNGRLVTITAPRSGGTELGVDIFSLYRRQISIVGCNSGTQKQDAMGETMRRLSPAFESGELIAPEEKSMSSISLDRAWEAYEGKVKKAVIVFE
jgi:NADPH:quinone reductase